MREQWWQWCQNCGLWGCLALLVGLFSSTTLSKAHSNSGMRTTNTSAQEVNFQIFKYSKYLPVFYPYVSVGPRSNKEHCHTLSLTCLIVDACETWCMYFWLVKILTWSKLQKSIFKRSDSDSKNHLAYGLIFLTLQSIFSTLSLIKWFYILLKTKYNEIKYLTLAQ